MPSYAHVESWVIFRRKPVAPLLLTRLGENGLIPLAVNLAPAVEACVADHADVRQLVCVQDWHFL